jgi:hypothetical protein
MHTFNDYWQSLPSHEKASLADKAGTSLNYLSQIANGHRLSGANLMSRLVAADENITIQMMRPDLYKPA